MLKTTPEQRARWRQFTKDHGPLAGDFARALLDDVETLLGALAEWEDWSMCQVSLAYPCTAGDTDTCWACEMSQRTNELLPLTPEEPGEGG